MNFSESKKISQCIFTTLIKVLKFVKKKLYLGPLHMSPVDRDEFCFGFI